jgi:hypothetical protein
LQHVGTAHFGFKRTFDCFDLPPNAPHAGEQLGFFADGVRHGSSLAY